MSRSPAIAREGYHHGHLSAALLQAARAVLARDGLDGLTLRAVAREAGVSHNAPYHHFPDKAALLEALAADGWDRLGHALREAREAAGRRSLDRLQAIGLAYVTFALADPPRFRLMTRPGGKTGLVGAAATRAYEVLLDTVGQGQRDRSLRAGDRAPLALTAWTAVHGLAVVLLDGLLADKPGSGVPPEALARVVTDLVIGGLRRRTARA
jgi:AcrR family transcriptional regulator